MSDSRCCCNCRRCIRTRNSDGISYNKCEVDGHYIGYIETFEGWCRRWAKDHKFDSAEPMRGEDDE